MASKDDRKYLESHEWHKTDGDLVVIGISQFAVEELTDITFLEILKTDGEVKAGEVFGEIESVKATSELYAGVDGEVVEVNQAVVDSPETINEDPWEAGWLIKIRPSDASQLDNLMDAAAYDGQHSA